MADNSGSAFPNSNEKIRVERPKKRGAGVVEAWTYPTGLTKRELFAAMAMHGFAMQYSSYARGEASECAKNAVEFADALLKELSKREGE